MEKDKIVSMQDIRRLSEEGVPVVSCLIIILSFKYKCNITFENIGVMLSNRCITDDMLKDSLLSQLPTVKTRGFPDQFFMKRFKK